MSSYKSNNVTAVNQQIKTKINDYRLEKTDGSEGTGSVIVFNPKINLPIQQQRLRLPISKYREHIMYLVEKFQTVVILGETGCGKSTQIPQYLYEAGWTDNGYMIGMTQPRRIATISLASRIADELKVKLGEEVGYGIRFESSFKPGTTKIKLVTDGYFLREMMYDPLLKNYSVIVLDEVHERSINTDIIMGLLKKILIKRPELRLIISSATIDPTRIAKFFDLSKMTDLSNNRTKTSTILSIEGRTFPIDVYYLTAPTVNYVQSSVDIAVKNHKEQAPGDILVFLTGQEEITAAISLAEEFENISSKYGDSLMPLALYSSLPVQEQLKVFQQTPLGKRKVVFCTNVAETSITVSNIVYVVDSGFYKLKYYNPDHKIETLITAKISKESADQRAGRAGRVKPGKVFRLCTEQEFDKLPDHTLPEIQRCNMASVIMQLKSLGIDKILQFSFISPPSANLMADGVQLLYALKFIDDNCHLTDDLGRQAAEFPLEPMITKMLLSSGQFGCSEEILTIASFLQLENIYLIYPNRKKEAERQRMLFAAKEGDHITYLNIYRAFVKKGRNQLWCKRHFINYRAMMHAEHIRANLKALLKKYKIPLISAEDDDVSVRRCITTGFFPCVAKYHPSGEYRTLLTNKPLKIHPQSVLRNDVPPTWVLYNQIITLKQDDCMRDVTVIDPLWLCELAPHYYQYGTDREVNSLTSNLPVHT